VVVTLQQVRTTREKVNALVNEITAFKHTLEGYEKTYFLAKEKYTVLISQRQREQTILEDLGRKFAIDEGENCTVETLQFSDSDEDISF
jgi:hypothetical protein